MLRKISDSINHCVKCDGETKHLIWAFNQELILEPICWRCFERADKRINLHPGWFRLRRNNFDGAAENRRATLQLVMSGAKLENQTPKQNQPLVLPVAKASGLARAA
jgi:hypothetical protein